jgi:hypothetical protein
MELGSHEENFSKSLKTDKGYDLRKSVWKYTVDAYEALSQKFQSVPVVLLKASGARVLLKASGARLENQCGLPGTAP